MSVISKNTETPKNEFCVGEETIILNVGGIKHVDGDFNAIVTKEELIEELLYFQIPFNNNDSDDKNNHNCDNIINIDDNHAIANAQLGAQKLDSFIIAMINMINEMKASFMQSVELKFPRHCNSIDSSDKSLRLSNENLYHPVRFMQPYCFVGYVLLKNFETDIYRYITSKVNGFHWEVERIAGTVRNKHLKVTIKIDINVKKRDVLANSSLAEIIAEQTDNQTSLTPSSKLSELLYIAKEQAPRPAPNYSTWYMTTHRAASICAIFSGKYAATGSADASLKVLDTSKMNSRSDEDRPVIRTLYDHLAPVNDLSFHPNGLVLASCSDDKSIKLFDLSKQGVKRSFRYLQIRFSSNGSQFVTSSLDGSIKIWDTINGGCIKTIENAHDGAPVSSVKFSKTGKYILSGGKDSTARLWEADSGKLILKYEGVVHKNQSLQTTFTYNEDYVLSSDELNNTIICWDSRTGLLLKKWGGHTNIIRCIAASPTEPGFISCSDDFRVR
ncbi:7874_t:CDS:10 [Entrophospora sp. SA101]|nr:7874_t:CDS:10 [Entrophospora sp. SA101]